MLDDSLLDRIDMSISIYYVAYCRHQFSMSERASIDELIRRYSVKERIEEYRYSAEGLNWESFCVHDPNAPTEPGVIFEGATTLPDNPSDALWLGLQHWCRLLSEIRRALPDSSRRMHVDDHDILWGVSETDPGRYRILASSSRLRAPGSSLSGEVWERFSSCFRASAQGR